MPLWTLRRLPFLSVRLRRGDGEHVAIQIRLHTALNLDSRVNLSSLSCALPLECLRIPSQNNGFDNLGTSQPYLFGRIKSHDALFQVLGNTVAHLVAYSIPRASFDGIFG